MDITWEQYKSIASEDISLDEEFIYRGHSDSSWDLVSSIYRTDIVKNPTDVLEYVNHMLPAVHEEIEAWENRAWDLASYTGLAEFLAFLQHNGFPTPLLDFSLSPYIAAYFAYESVNHFSPSSEKVSIYRFNQRKWSSLFDEPTDVANTNPRVSVIRPYVRGNHKLQLQQGRFLWSNIYEIESHVRDHEEFEGQILTKYSLAVADRPRIIKELSLMGVTATQLNPCIESVCKRALENIIGLIPMRTNANK